ncbi:Methyltransferase type 11 [Magnetococcus marinus MC-1]|uniref:Methyltransferase type 11 n=1 Tax=Magnetococcus marinus (strain ATCC BAA-1437 / JCM 17883 / MC-1) TaxID=156889 RepID=A0L4T9_MAGMM|nr:class I SAM-dependent methyltransferase [Magnetococcus marinus]ABK42982.1 Methyltransferase type 11 [Magnetococcus marinus MC-1]
MGHHHHHHPKHRFDPSHAARLLDPARRGIEDPHALVQEIGIKPGMALVDLGCGAGFFTPALLQTVGAEGSVTAVELQPEVLAFFRGHVGTPPNLQDCCADLTQTGLPAAHYDAVFIAFTLHEVTVAEALVEIKRLLKPGGVLVALDWGVFGPCPERADGKKMGPPEDHRLLLDTLRGLLQAAGLVEEAAGERLGGCQYWLRAHKPMEV